MFYSTTAAIPAKSHLQLMQTVKFYSYTLAHKLCHNQLDVHTVLVELAKFLDLIQVTPVHKVNF